MTARRVRLERLVLDREDYENPQNDGADVEKATLDLGEEQPEVMATLERYDSEDFETDSSQTDESDEYYSEEERINQWKMFKVEQWRKNTEKVENS